MLLSWQDHLVIAAMCHLYTVGVGLKQNSSHRRICMTT
jgi:hypothetical protein